MASAKLTQLIYKLNHNEYRERCLAENELVALDKEAVDLSILVQSHNNSKKTLLIFTSSYQTSSLQKNDS
jgi:hypothetical protein